MERKLTITVVVPDDNGLDVKFNGEVDAGHARIALGIIAENMLRCSNTPFDMIAELIAIAQEIREEREHDGA